MRVIHKFPLTGKATIIMVPREAVVLRVAMQGAQVFVWVLLKISAPKEPMPIVWFNTGEAIPDMQLTYIGTLHTDENQQVTHYFCVPPKRQTPRR